MKALLRWEPVQAALPLPMRLGSLVRRDEPRIIRKPCMAMARAMNSPSADSEIISRVGRCGRATGRPPMERAILPCQKQASTPPGRFSCSSTASRLIRRQRRVCSTSVGKPALRSWAAVTLTLTLGARSRSGCRAHSAASWQARSST